MTFSGARFGRLLSLGLLCAAGIVGIVMALRLELWRQGSPGPGLFPFVASAGIVSLSALSMAFQLFRSTELPGEKTEPVALQGYLRVAIYVAALIGYPLLLEPLGFYVTTVLALLTILKLAERLPWRTTVLVILGGLVFTHFLFAKWLGVYFPSGSLWDELF